MRVNNTALVPAALLPCDFAQAKAETVYQANGIKIGEVTRKIAIIWTRLTARPERNGPDVPWPRTTRKKTSTHSTIPDGGTLADMEAAVPAAEGSVKLVS